MYRLNLNDSDKQLIDNYNLIKNVTRIKDKNGEYKEYTAYNCSFPYSFIAMYNNPKEVYFYERLNKFYVTNLKPPAEYSSKKVTLHCRKNSKQKTSKENMNKPWAKIVTIPKTLIKNLGDYSSLSYILHINQKDYVNYNNALLEVFLT